MRKSNKLLSILLSLVMLIGLLPTSVFAAGGTEFVHFAIEEHWGVYFEQTGSNNLYPITLTNENKLSVPLPALYRTDYDGYIFDGWYIDSTDTKVTQDTVFDGYTVVVDRWTYQEKDVNTVISNIRLNNVELEAGMTTAEYNAAVQGATATVNGAPADAITADSATTYTIYKGLNKSGDPLGAEDEVEVGQDYSVVTKIKLADGYTFSPNITFESDEGMCASERFLGGADIYTKEWNTLSNAIEVTINFMNTEYYFAQTPESRHLENYAQYRNWYKVSKVDGLESVTLQYEVDGAWAVFIDNIPFEAVGEEAGGYVTVSPYVDTTKTFRLVANYANGTVYSEPFEISWACLNPVIENIGIGITAPQNGYSPEYTATTDTNRCALKSEDASTVKNGIKWTGDVVGELAVSGSKFNNDNDYTVSIKLVAQDGYTFANNVTATINANNANVSIESETEIRVSYTFPKPEKAKWYVSFNNAGGYASGTMQSVQVEEGEYTLPEPTYTPNTGYVFEGWLVNGLLKQPGDVITVTENIILNAKWKDTNDYDAPHGFTKQPSDASNIVGMQIQYSVDNFTVDPSITYENVIAQIYDSESGEWTTATTEVSAGNGIVENYGQQFIIFSSDAVGEFTFRLYAIQGSTKVAISENFTVTWAAKQFTTQPQGDMVVVGETVTVTADKNFYVEKYEIEYNDGGVWKLYQEVSGGWNAFSFDFTSDAAKSVTFRIKAYAEGDVYDEENDCFPIVLIDTSEEFTITWTSNEHVHTYGAIPNGNDETNHWKECTDPACPDKAHSKIEVEVHKDNTADYKCDVCGYDMPVPTYTVSFDGNGGTGTMADVNGVAGTYTLPENGFTAPDGKQFKAWSVGGNEKTPGTSINVTEDTTVTAIWEDVPALTGTVTITGDAKYGSTLTATVENSNNTGELHYQWVRDTSNNITGANEQTYTILLENNINSTLKCIVTSSVQTGSIVSAPTAYVTKGDNLAVPTGLAGVAPTTLGGYDCYITGTTTAMEWSKYTDFHSTEGACSDGQTQVYHPGTYYVRYRQTSTYNAGTNYATVIVPDFGGAATYTVSFEANGGTGTMADVNGVAGTYTLPENGFTAPDGKQFKAWSVGGDEKAVGAAITVSANTTVTAVWEDIPVVTYTVSFNANGGTDTMADVNGISGEYTLPACAFTAPIGQQFKAWAIESVGGEQKMPGEKITVNSNTVIYAIWETIPVTTYIVSFEANGGTGTMADVTGIAGTYTLPANSFTAPDGKQFKAWSVDGNEKAVGAAITVTANTTVTAVWEDIPVTTYTVTFDANGGSVTPANATTEATGKLSTLPTPTRSGSYTFKGWYTASSGGTQVTVDKVYTENTTIYAQWNYTGSTGGGSGVSKYTVKFETNGGTTVASKSVTRNAKLEEPTAPTKDGFKFEGWYTDKELKTAYDFDTKVTKSFTLYAKWTEIEKEPENDNPVDTDKWVNPFTDVKENDWFFADVRYVAENNLMNGVAEDKFAPNETLTRAMLVTVLYRAEGEPAVNKSIPFADIDMGAWYANAVVWAQQNGIVNGVSETEFAPNDNITREQIAAIMHRYAQYKGYDVSVGENTNILSYDDFDSISEYAIAAMQYACGSGLMKGKTASTLNPKDNATRAEIAAILHRFIESNK